MGSRHSDRGQAQQSKQNLKKAVAVKIDQAWHGVRDFCSKSFWCFVAVLCVMIARFAAHTLSDSAVTQADDRLMNRIARAAVRKMPIC